MELIIDDKLPRTAEGNTEVHAVKDSQGKIRISEQLAKYFTSEAYWGHNSQCVQDKLKEFHSRKNNIETTHG